MSLLVIVTPGSSVVPLLTTILAHYECAASPIMNNKQEKKCAELTENKSTTDQRCSESHSVSYTFGTEKYFRT